jgi:hypothetical protein
MQKSEKSLIIESKSFQTIRILNLFYSDNSLERETEIMKTLSTNLIERLNGSEEFKFYIDFFLKIEKAWQGNRVSFQRKKSTKNVWKKIDFEECAFSHPLFLIIGSTFNEAIDLSYRNALQIKSQTGARIEPISYYAFGNFLINKEFPLENINNYNCAILFFQISDPRFTNKIDKPAQFFDNDIFHTKNDINDNYGVIAYGLLRGDMEGFILYGLKDALNGLDKLKKSFCGERFGLLSSISPIALFYCSWEKRYEGSSNLELFSEISNLVLSNHD